MTHHQDRTAWGMSSSNKFGVLGELHKRTFQEDVPRLTALWLHTSDFQQGTVYQQF